MPEQKENKKHKKEQSGEKIKKIKKAENRKNSAENNAKQSAEKHNKIKKKRRKNGWFFIIALIVFLSVYLSVSFLLSSGGAVSTVVVKKGTVEDSIYVEGYIFKDSTVINAPRGGYIDCLKEEEEKVKIGEAVAAIYTDKVNVGLKSQMAELDSKIAALEKSITYKSSSDGDSAKTEQSISDKMKKIGAFSDAKNIEEISQIKKDVTAMLTRRSNLSGSKDEEAELASLRAEKDSLSKSLSEQAVYVSSPSAGAFTSRVDGAEELLSLSSIKENRVNHSFFKELASLKLENNVKEQVEQGDPIGKTVNNYEWYLAAEIDTAESELLKVGSEIKLRFTELDENEINATVYSISSEEDGKVTVIVKSNKYVKSIYYTSTARTQLIKHTYTGIKVPQKALRIQNDKKGVYVMRGNVVRFVPVNINYSDKDWVITSENEENGGIKLYDEVVLKGKKLYDGKVVK